MGEQALGFDGAPQRRFAGQAHRIGRDPQFRQAERAQVIHPFLMRAKDAQRLAAEPIDDVVRQIAGAHVGDRRGIDHIARRPAQHAAEESQARLAGPGAERGEAVGADVSGEAGLAGVPGPGVVDGDEGRAPQTGGENLGVLGVERLQIDGQQTHDPPFRNHHAHAIQQRQNPIAAHLSLKVQHQDQALKMRAIAPTMPGSSRAVRVPPSGVSQGSRR